MNISILSPRSQSEIEALMRQAGVDTGGIAIMAPKAGCVLVKLSRLPIFAANILKQESLSIGADTAVAKHALTGKIKNTDCIIIGNLSHYKRLSEKLKKQPYGLNRVGVELERILAAYQNDDFKIELGRYSLNLNSHTHIMGVVNVTPDSFSQDGILDPDEAADYALRLVNEGADIIDIGAESSRPGAKKVQKEQELRRLIPVIKKAVKKVKAPISVDTYKPEVALQALDNGASIINDITALNYNPKMAGVIKRYKAGLILMHMKGRPSFMQNNPRYKSLLFEIKTYLDGSIKKALDAGIDFKKIIIDPGIGFGKSLRNNLSILKNLSQLKVLGRPILVGVSRKSFLGEIAAREVDKRLGLSISANCLSVINGAKILRVHDVKETRDSLKVLDSILKEG